MIFVVTAENCTHFTQELRAMHAQRKQLFIDQLGWDLIADDGHERDQFDTPDAIYLLYYNDTGALRASARMLPTDAPHLLQGVFADLCPGGVPTGPDIWESTRFCPAPDAGPAEKRQLLGVMIAGMIEAALIFGVSRITFVAGAALRPLALQAGWDACALGPTIRRGGDRLTACIANADPVGLKRVRARFDLSSPLLRYAPARLAA